MTNHSDKTVEQLAEEAYPGSILGPSDMTLRRLNTIHAERAAFVKGFAAARASGGERGPVVTHLNMDPNASEETREAVKEMVHAAYHYKPPGKVEPVELARQFHEVYERLAPSFGYETRQETRAFDPNSPNGKLMVAVCAEILRTRLTGLVGGDQWISVDVREPDGNTKERANELEVLGYNEKWIHPDWNPLGIRSCTFSGAGWQCAKWCGDHDQYESTEDDPPTHWQPLPPTPPKDRP